MHKKQYLTVLAIVVLVVAGYFVLRQSKLLPGGAASEKVLTYSWQLAPAANDASGNPQTDVSLDVNGKVRKIGTYTGTCNVLQMNEKGMGGERADVGEITRVQCYFAGGGNEIGVFAENEETFVKVGDLSEGDAETAPTRGNFKTVLTL